MGRFQNKSIGWMHQKSTQCASISLGQFLKKPKPCSNQTIFQHGKSYKYFLFCSNYLMWNKLIFETKYEIHQAKP